MKIQTNCASNPGLELIELQLTQTHELTQWERSIKIHFLLSEFIELKEPIFRTQNKGFWGNFTVKTINFDVFKTIFLK